MIEKIFSIFLLGISVLGYCIAKNFKIGFMIDNGLGASFFPKLVCVILGILSILLLINGIKQDDYKFSKKNLITLYIVIVCIGYIMCLNRLGYLISTILFSFIIIKLLNKNKLIFNLIFSLLFPAGIYLLFSKIFSVSLPSWGF